MKENWTYMLVSLTWGIFWIGFGIGVTAFESGCMLPVAQNTAIAVLVVISISYFIKRRFKLKLEYIVFPILIISCYFILTAAIAINEYVSKDAEAKKPEMMADPIYMDRG